MRKKNHKNRKDDGLLGPGAFNPSYKLTKEKHKVTKFGRSKRSNSIRNHKNLVPGPGHYSSMINKTHEMRRTTGTRFGQSKQRKSQKVREIPGPGTYDNGSIFSKKTKGCKIGERLKGPHRPVSLGPAAYRPKLKLVKPSTKGGK